MSFLTTRVGEKWFLITINWRCLNSIMYELNKTMFNIAVKIQTNEDINVV